jgi:hypothetical protein
MLYASTVEGNNVPQKKKDNDLAYTNLIMSFLDIVNFAGTA